MLLIASSEYNLALDETAAVIALAYGETRFGAQDFPGYFRDLVENGSNTYFETMYGGKNGNELGTNDAITYRGRGFIQITFKDTYRVVGNDLGWDLISNPDLASQPQNAAVIAAHGLVNGYFSADQKLGSVSFSSDIMRNPNGSLNLSQTRRLNNANAHDYKIYEARAVYFYEVLQQH